VGNCESRDLWKGTGKGNGNGKWRVLKGGWGWDGELSRLVGWWVGGLVWWMMDDERSRKGCGIGYLVVGFNLYRIYGKRSEA